MINIICLSIIVILFVIILITVHLLVVNKKKNITEVASLKSKIMENEEKYILTIDGANDAIWEWNLDNNNVFISEKWTQITGYSVDENKNLVEFMKRIIHEDDLERVYRNFNDYVEEKVTCYQSEFRLKTKNNTYKWVFLRSKGLRNENNKIIKMAGSITDITQRRLIEEELKHRAYYDVLTNLPNKLYAVEVIEKTVEEYKLGTKKGAIIFLDLDDFKKVNDILGHHYGDQLLRIIAELLKLSFNEEDTISRFGGDEFLIVINVVKSKEDIILKCNKLIDIFKKTFEIGEKHIYTSASMGITLFPTDSDDINTLLINADAAMYKAKETGKNKYCFFDKQISSELKRKNEIEKNLRQAIEENELEIVYQPQVDIHKRIIVGLEALLRWNSKNLGKIKPYEFIPIAEETGLINGIGEWVIKNVCKQIKKWEFDSKIFIKVSVNVSSIQLQDENFIEKTKQIVYENDINPGLIELEITETSLMNNLEKGIAILTELKNSGFKISLDDFGTGYSSLKYLRTLPINTLKIDKSFVDNITSNKKDEEMAKGVIQLAHNINLDVIVEGVETEEQYNLLERLNSNIIQGYYFSRPVSPEKIEEMLLKEGKQFM